MRRLALLGLATACLACGLTDWLRRPDDRASRRQLPIPFPPQHRIDLVTINGSWMRAAEIATADFFTNGDVPATASEPEQCLSRRGSYDVTVWSDEAPTPDGGPPDLDASVGASDGGPAPAPQPGILFVTISLRPDACEFGPSPPLDVGATYAIDAHAWRIVGWSP